VEDSRAAVSGGRAIPSSELEALTLVEPPFVFIADLICYLMRERESVCV
jgi:hypothetical protein